MDRAIVTKWLELYQEAWRTDDPEAIGRLFTEDASYYTGPFAEPWQGVQQIVEDWQAIGDAEAEWDFRYEIVADGEDLAVVQGWTIYGASADQPENYSNIWIIRFAPDGRAREFREWWVEEPTD